MFSVKGITITVSSTLLTLAADHVLFNSQFHLDSFHLEGEKLLKNFPDYNETKTMDIIKKKKPSAIFRHGS